MSYTEYGFYRRDERECRYQEYGDLSQAGTSSNRSGGFDDEYKKFVNTMRGLKRLEEDGFEISREDREAIIRGYKTIEEFKAEHGQKEVLAEPEPAPEVPETAVKEPVQETPVEHTAEPENKPKKRSKKKSEEVVEEA